MRFAQATHKLEKSHSQRRVAAPKRYEGKGKRREKTAEREERAKKSREEKGRRGIYIHTYIHIYINIRKLISHTRTHTHTEREMLASYDWFHMASSVFRSSFRACGIIMETYDTLAREVWTPGCAHTRTRTQRERKKQVGKDIESVCVFLAI